jgi:hypothetical protein
MNRSEPTPPHGCRLEAGKVHPTLDLAYWLEQVPPPQPDKDFSRFTTNAPDVVHMHRRRQRAFKKAPEPDATEVDLFLWQYEFQDSSPTTRLGGLPWRESGKPWPRGVESGIPLCFLGQLNFVDSSDVLSGKLPDDVLLLFGGWSNGRVDLYQPIQLEWSPTKLKEPCRLREVPWTGQLPFTLTGVRHRIRQYPHTPMAFFGEDSLYDAEWYGTIIGRSAFLTGNADPVDDLIACVSSLSSDASKPWPLTNVPIGRSYVAPKGHSVPTRVPEKFAIGDMGVIIIERNGKGEIVAHVQL